MKTICNPKISPLLKTFLLENRDYLCISAICYFDFNNPEELFSDQEMWDESMKQLDDVALDMAMPKQNAEILLCGSCYNSDPNSSASHVKLEVGSVNKELYVFGERYWNMDQISRAETFTKMPLRYTNSFGGIGFTKNPLGKGYADTSILPNIEDPKNLISEKGQKRDPAGFMPYDISWEQCAKKLGTYDEKWKRELWPGFAEDMDYTYFNRAPLDQQFKNYLNGGENIKLINMHPEHKVLTSNVPKFSVRCFATSSKDEKFEEIEMKRDTLWLFPELKKGIIIFRATRTVEDEIYSDLKYLNLQIQKADEIPKSLEEYLELQKKELQTKEEVEEIPADDGAIKEAYGELFDMPRAFKEADLEFEEKRPTMPVNDTQRLKNIHKNIDKAITELDPENEDDSKKIANLVASKDEMSSIFKTKKEMNTEALKKVKEIMNDPNIPQESKDKINLENFEPKVKVWNDYAFEFLCGTVKKLNKEPEQLYKLRSIGLAKRTIKRSWIGYNKKEISFKASKWNFDDSKTIKIAKGFVIPRFENSKLLSLQIIDIENLLKSNSEFVEGSDKNFENLNCFEDETFPFFYFKEDLQAYLFNQECYDICNSLSADDISKCSNRAQNLLKSASIIFYLTEDGVVEKLPNAIKFDTKEYKDFFDMHKNSVDIRLEVLNNLPEHIKKLFSKQRDFSASGVNKRVNKVTGTISDKLKDDAKKIKAQMVKEKNEALAKMDDLLKKHGLDPIDRTKLNIEKDESDLMSESDVIKGFDKMIEDLKAKSSENNLDLDEKISKLQKLKNQTLADVKKASADFSAAKERLKKIEGDAKKRETKNETNPEFTREMVIEYYKKGKSLIEKNLSSLDLSKLDLKKIDLRGANLFGVNFSDSDLSQADLEEANASYVNFTKTILDGVDLTNTLLTEATFINIFAKNILAKGTLFDKVGMSQVKFLDSDLSDATFQEMSMEKVDLSGSNLQNAIFSESVVIQTVFNNTNMIGTSFSQTVIAKSDFQNIESEKLDFNKSVISETDFSHSKLENMRIMSETLFQKCNFIGSNMDTTTLYEAKLTECNLQKSSANKMLITKSEILNCDFRAMRAHKSRFEFATFTDINFSGFDMLKGSFHRATLQDCDFKYANLYSVDFYKMKLYKTHFKDADLKRSSLENRLEFIDE